VQEEGSLPSERSGEGGAKRRSAQAKRGRLGCLLRAPEAEPLRKAWLPCFARSAGEAFRVGVAGGKGPQRRVPEDGGFLAGCRLGGAFPPFWECLGLMSVGCVAE
jgi:hypothetical protein